MQCAYDLGEAAQGIIKRKKELFPYMDYSLEMFTIVNERRFNEEFLGI